MKINLPPTVLTPALQKVWDALAPAPTRLVGGVVRDTLAGLPPKEADLATAALPEEVLSRLKKAGINAIPTGLAHGTVTAVVGEEKFEITTLRRDVRTDGRHAEVVFTESFTEDAARRDLTFNALYLERDGTLHDPHHGREDLAAGRVRFIGEAAHRLREDWLRTLRFFRFYALFGKEKPDAATLEALQNAAAHLETLSAERVTAELFKWLAAPHPAAALSLARACGVDAGLGLDFSRAEQTERLQRPTPLIRLCLLAAGAEILLQNKRLRLSRLEEGFIRTVWAANPSLPPQEGLYRHGREAWVAALDVARARGANIPAEQWRAALEAPVPQFPLYGRDILALGIPAGPQVGELLRKVEDWWLKSGLPDRKKCLARLAEEVG